MPRAFLCHSSADKQYVQTVARKLGRGRVAFDEFAFAPGQDFRDEIRRHLDRSDLFDTAAATMSRHQLNLRSRYRQASDSSIAVDRTMIR